jgi:beta-glucosidase/6-phospho-beta-glucosidase/beta-galactosidase
MNLQNASAILRGTRSMPSLPESFLFGVATADHQCEAYDPTREDIRDVWEREHKLVTRGKATDFEHRFNEDIELARQLGCKAFRFSIAWSRVEPAPGQFDDAAFDYYRRLIAAIHSAGMEPIITLHHFTWPVHVQQRGGMIDHEFPALYTRYVTEVVNRFGQDVRRGAWITFNEPSQLIYGYIKPWWEEHYFVPPGLPEGATLDDQVAALGSLIRNLFVAHTQARQIIKAAHPDALVGANPLLLGLPIWLQRLINWNTTRIKSEADLSKHAQRIAAQRFRASAAEERNPLLRWLRQWIDPLVKQYSILSTVVASNWWHLGMAGRLSEFLCPKACVGQQDFVGLDYYWGISQFRLDRVGRLIQAALGHFEQAPVWPGALYGHLKYQASLFPSLPLLIVENGSVDMADNVDRAMYIREHIRQVQRAVKDGVSLMGYICWAVTSNREWGLPFDRNSDFGLYHIDLDTDPDLKRIPTPAVAVYQEIIAGRGT